MKKIYLLSLLVLWISLSFAQEKYSIKVKIDGFKDTTAFMSYFYGKGQYYKDTASIDSKGFAHFSKKDTLEEGMYSILIGSNKIFDFLVDDQELSFTTSKSAPIQDMKTKGGQENIYFYEYLKFLNAKQKVASELKETKEKSEPGSEAYKNATKSIDELDEEVKVFLNDFSKKHKGSFTVTFLNALQAPEVPEPPLLENGAKDSLFAFRYFKEHFFDGFYFTDDRLIRTAAFYEKISYYMDKLNVQVPDTIIKACDFLLSKMANSPEMFKYTLNNFTSKYEKSELMGMDAAFVHLGKNYYMKGKAPWMTDKQMKKLSERVKALDPLLIGKKAPNLIVRDTAQKKMLQLYDIEAKYTIVYIWSPDCGHCKEATPKLKKLYDKVKSRGVEVFGVGNDFENEHWIDFINKHDLNWINGSDGGDFRSNFRDTWDVYSTPQTYLLDENKVILSKKMDIPSLENLLEYFFKQDEKEKNE